MPSNNRGRKSTNAGSKSKQKPKAKGKAKAQATEEAGAPTIADGDKASFSFSMSTPGPAPTNPVTPPQRAPPTGYDATPTRLRGKPSTTSAFVFNLGASTSGVAQDENPFVDSSSHPGPPGHADSNRSLQDLSQLASLASDNFKTLTTSTPYATHGAASTMKGQTSKIEGETLAKSIGFAPTSGPLFLRQQKFAQGIQTEAIESWLRSTESDGVYGAAWLVDKSDKTKASFDVVWNLPEVASEEKQLYPLLEKIITAISDKFVQPHLGPGISRKLKDTHKESLTHMDGETSTSPDFAVQATGPSFELPYDGKETGYTNITAVFDAKRDKNMIGIGILRQMGVYARQIFAQQPNRIFVRCMVLSEKRAQIVQFDRAGAQYSQFVSLNKEPEMFVRMVIELFGGGSERSIGFDDSISWIIVDGKKDSGTLTFGPPGKEIIYDLIGTRPVSHSFDIRGCATTIWGVTERGGTGESFIVKDSWTENGRTMEHKLLEMMKDVKGVSKMVDFHLRDIKTSDFRCATTVNLFTDRQASRLIMEAHGRSIEDGFSDPVEVLHALSDILVAHFQVYGKNILHRNITNKTVFLGSLDAPVGFRGVLTGFEGALNFHPKSGDTTISKEARLGTRFFQSYMILRFLSGLGVGEAPPHDHMDDLECVFNLVCFLFFTRRPDGKPRDKKDKARNMVRGWDSDSPEDALAFKSALFNPASGQKEAAIKLVSQSWGMACGALFKAFWEWVYGIQQRKGEILRRYMEEQEIEQAMMITELKRRMKGKNSQQNGVGEQGGCVATSRPDGEIEEGGKNSAADEDEEDGEDEVFAVLQPNAPVPRKEVAFKKGLFAPLMENGMVADHYIRVIHFFITAIAKIQVCPAQNGPPAIDTDRPLKRKREADQLAELKEVVANTCKKFRRSAEEAA
ncbi:hypothetical protein FA13DRAFT_1798636 [Coprinellus micaceus]|uniref:Fungal-type protein kinase domain-containing protein n=1 Tax=Coprinellus micaceus TaxID=71717 RepID=A0A4Y7SL79_COPMI|nr:hypothetical protein FA13DRAFT_1798636 [Coprinellus micaceus]